MLMYPLDHLVKSLVLSSIFILFQLVLITTLAHQMLTMPRSRLRHLALEPELLQMRFKTVLTLAKLNSVEISGAT